MSPAHPVAPRTGPTVAILPRADAATPEFAGFAFATGPSAPDAAGVFVLTRRIGDLLHPALVGEAEDMADAIAALRAADPATAEADGCFWLLRAQPRQRAHIARDLTGKYNPPLNAAHRSGPAAPDIAALIPDRLDPAALPAGPTLAVGSIPATEEELALLVERFYAAARADEVIGPVFARSIADWEDHHRRVRDFWSRAVLGTTRYSGNPYSAHIPLGLKPEHFDRWIALFRAAAQATLRPEAASFAVAKVQQMGRCFQTGLFLPPIAQTDDHASAAE